MSSHRPRRFTAVGAALLVLLLASSAAADPTKITVPVTCATESGATIDLDPGRYIPEQIWLDLDTEHKRLQDSVTRLEAENVVLSESSKPAWYYVAGAALLGVAIGVYSF